MATVTDPPPEGTFTKLTPAQRIWTSLSRWKTQIFGSTEQTEYVDDIDTGGVASEASEEQTT